MFHRLLPTQAIAFDLHLTVNSTELAKPQGGFHAVKAEREPSESDNKPAQKNRSATPNKKQYQVPKSQRQISVQNPALPFRDKLSQNSPLGNDEDTKNLPPSKEDDLKKALQYDTNLSPRFEQLKYSQGQTRELPSGMSHLVGIEQISD